MKLYFSPGACSMASHIALQETGLPYEAVQVDLRSKKTAGDQDYLKINPKGYVPALELDNGQTMSEGVAILQWLADQKPEKKLIPAWGTAERYKAIEWMNYVATEIHKNFSPLYNPQIPDATREICKGNIVKRLGLIEDRLNSQAYLMGENFGVADAYLFTVLSWSPRVGVDLSGFPKTLAYLEKIKGRPSVQSAMKAEGLI